MAISLRNGLGFGGSYECGFQTRENCSLRPLTSAIMPINDQTKRIDLKRQIGSTGWKLNCNSSGHDHAENQGEETRSTRWWEVAGTDNFREIISEEDLKDSLKNAGNKLVVVYFYSPACGGCRPLHPKMYQIAEAYQEVKFLKVNHEVHKLLCNELNIQVLPFFQLHRGTQGHLRSFSCTVATIQKLKDALEKHGNGRYILGPAKELEDGASLKLASIKKITFNLSSWDFR